MSSRPTSHYLAGLYLLVWPASIVIAIADLYVSDCVPNASPLAFCSARTLLWPLIWALPPIAAVIALMRSRAKWVYYLIAALLLTFPAYLVAFIGHLLVTRQWTGFLEFALVLLSLGCLLWLFGAYACGRVSRAYYDRA